MRHTYFKLLVSFATTYGSSATFSALEAVPDYPEGVKSYFNDYNPSPELVEMEFNLSPLSLADAFALAKPAMEDIKANFSNEGYRDKLMSEESSMWKWFVDRNRSSDMDNVVSVPQQLSIHEWVIVGNETMSITPTDVLANRLESIIMKVDSNPFSPAKPAVMKYQLDCAEKNSKVSPMHQLSREYFFLDMIHRATVGSENQIIPTPYFLSPPVLLDTMKSMKTDFDMDPDSRGKCIDQRTHLRYLLMDKTGMSLEDFLANCPGFKIPFLDGLIILKQVFVALKRIHSMGIIHGDIHRGNIVRSLSDRTKILLIDFGLARLYEGELPEAPFRAPPKVGMDSSPWTAQGYHRSFRDDVFRAMITMASLMGGPKYLQAMSSFEDAFDTSLVGRFLARGDVFRNPISRRHIIDDYRELYNPSKYQPIIHALDHLQARVRAMTRVNDFPNHDELISIVDEVINIVSPPDI